MKAKRLFGFFLCVKKNQIIAFEIAFTIFIINKLDMKKLLFVGSLFMIIAACTVKKTSLPLHNDAAAIQNDTVRIANEELQYEIIIIEPGFDSWLRSTAKPRNYYSLSFLENKNYFFVSAWNNRALQPQRYNSNLYEMRIDYLANVRYGYEVNYLLYNYFVYFQSHYKQKL